MEIGQEEDTAQSSSCALDMDSSSRHAIGFHNIVRGLNVQAVRELVRANPNDVV
jgi:hypothetical protein